MAGFSSLFKRGKAKEGQEGATQAKPKRQHDKNWSGFKNFMNKISGGSMYAQEKSAHQLFKANRELQEHNAHMAELNKDVMAAFPELTPDQFTHQGTATREQALEIRRQMESVNTAHHERNQQSNAFIKQHFGDDEVISNGSKARRNVDGLYRNTGASDEDYEYNHEMIATMSEVYNPEYQQETSTTNAQGGNLSFRVARIVTTLLDDLVAIRDSDGFEKYASESYANAKDMLGKINSTQELLKKYTQTKEVKEMIIAMTGYSMDEYNKITMDASLAVKRAGNRLGQICGMDNVSPLQVAVQHTMINSWGAEA